MVDALDLDVAQALPDVGDRVLLVDVAVHGEAQALLASTGEDLGELERWVALLVGVEADTHEMLLVRQRLLQGGHGRVRRHVA